MDTPSYDRAELGEQPSIPRALLYSIAALSGYLSLSLEILWIRAISFNVQGTPHVFGEVLGLFLLGIALGSLSGKRFCEKPTGHPLTFVARLFLFGSLVYYLSISLFVHASLLGKGLSLLLSYLSVIFVAFIYGKILPIISHYGIESRKPVGVSLSRIYMANIAGSTLGPILTGFVLLNHFSLERNILYVSVFGLVAAAVIAPFAPRAARWRALAAAAIACAMLALCVHGQLYGEMLEKLRYGPKFSTMPPFKHVVQNRAGIITVQPDPRGDIISGGGVYDGRFNLDPVLDSNGIVRAYMIAALHAEPTDVLEIGLSSGSWAWVLAAYEKIQRITVIEINPGYTQIIERYADGHSDVLVDPKLKIVNDDGRRWLNRNPDRRFDFILMNTTFHWRSNVTSLVSEEFLRLAKQHLKPGGVIYYNTTGSPDIPYTAACLFRYVTTFGSFVAASDRPIRLTEREKLENFLRFRTRGKTLFDAASPDWHSVAERLAHSQLPDERAKYLARTDLDRITDDNMLTEFKKVHWNELGGYLYRWYNPDLSWRKLRERQIATTRL